VHHQVKKLEDELGLTLFERVAKDEVRLTAAGERLYSFCAPFFEELPVLIDRMKSDAVGGVLRIDASGLVLRELMPTWIQRLRAAHADVEIELAEIQVPESARLARGECHVIVDFVYELDPALEARRVATAHTFLALPGGHRLAKSAPDPKQLAKEPFIAYHASLPHHAVQMAAVKRKIGIPERVLSASSVDSILALVRAGLGYSVVPWLHPDGPKIAGVTTWRQSGPGTEFPILALTRPGGGEHPLVKALFSVAPES
jgi:DNA-binding transcriptional LysR family regulator